MVGGPVAGSRPDAVRGAEAVRSIVPRTPADHPPAAIACRSCAAVARVASVARVPAILRPLQHVAVHIVETPDWARSCRPAPCLRWQVTRAWSLLSRPPWLSASFVPPAPASLRACPCCEWPARTCCAPRPVLYTYVPGQTVRRGHTKRPQARFASPMIAESGAQSLFR